MGGLVTELLAEAKELFGSLDTAINAINLLIALIAGGLSYLFVSLRAARQALRVERSQAYMDLEIASIDSFRYRAEYAYAIHWAVTEKNPRRTNERILKEQVDQYFYQCLNLFEVASRFRKAKIITPDVYASWVAWFFEVLEVEYFRKQWDLEYRDNYTQELQAIFDGGLNLWARLAPDHVTDDPDHLGRPGEEGDITDTLRKEFYRHVGWVVPCSVIAGWIEKPQRRPPLVALAAARTQFAMWFYRKRHHLHPSQHALD
jgi:hypothetical protein